MTEPVAGPAGAALVDGAAGVVYSAPFLLAARASGGPWRLANPARTELAALPELLDEAWIHPGRGQVVPILSE